MEGKSKSGGSSSGSGDVTALKLFINRDEESESLGKLWSRKERRVWVAALFCGCAMMYSARTAMPLCVPVISKELKWDKTESGSVLSAFFWGYTMTQIIGGYLSDHIGGDIVITIAGVAWSMLTFWTPKLVYLYSNKTSAISFIVIARVLLGASQGVHYPSLSSILVSKVDETERSFIQAFIFSGSHFGTLFSGSVGSLLMEQYGWQSVFYFVGALGMVWVLVLRYILIAKQRKKAMILSMKNDIAPASNMKEAPRVPWLALFTKMSFWCILIGHFCMNNAFFILLSWLPTYFHENFPGAKGWVFNVVPWVVTIPSSVFSGWLADHMMRTGYSITFTRKAMETVALCGTGLFLMLLAYTSTYYSALFCMASAVACSGFHLSGIIANPQDIAPKYAGSVFGIMNSVGAIPGFAGVYLAGYILDMTQSWSAVFMQTSVVCFIGWIFFTIFGTGKKIVT